MEKFTPGPWLADEAEGLWGVFEDRDGSPIAVLEENLEPLKPEHAEANANLIAAAPELYAELDRIVKHMARGDWVAADHVAKKGATVALAKARGEAI
jgi:hypothetical protein